MNFCMDFCMDMYRDTCLKVWNTTFCIESLFGMVFFIWLWSSMEEKFV